MQYPTTRLEIETMLRDKGIQPTSQRVEVLFHLYQGGHQTADELHEHLNQEFSKVSRATVYNTLNLLKSQGLIGEVVLEPGRSIFDANPSEHYHFYNVDTKELTDIPAAQIRLDCLPGYPEGKVFRGADVIIRIGEPG
ncbi:Peroxide-responsive repressor PerR [compost metagenome]